MWPQTCMVAARAALTSTLPEESPGPPLSGLGWSWAHRVTVPSHFTQGSTPMLNNGPRGSKTLLFSEDGV